MYIKKKILCIFSVFLLAFGFSACQNKDQNPNTKGNQIQTQERKQNQGKNKEQNQNTESSKKMVKVNGHIYKDTNLVNSGVTCDAADGKIKFAVDENSKIQNDDEGNFGVGYEYQLMDKTHINVNIDGRWIIFEDVSSKNDKMPDGVANIKVKVKEVQEGGVLCEIMQIPKEFEHIFKNKKPDQIKPVFLTLEKFDGEKIMQGTELEVYFDGRIKNLKEETSSPITFEEIYLVK